MSFADSCRKPFKVSTTTPMPDMIVPLAHMAHVVFRHVPFLSRQARWLLEHVAVTRNISVRPKFSSEISMSALACLIYLLIPTQSGTVISLREGGFPEGFSVNNPRPSKIRQTIGITRAVRTVHARRPSRTGASGKPSDFWMSDASSLGSVCSLF